MLISPYSYLFGVPVSVFGFLWFVVLTCSSHKLLKTVKKSVENQSHASASQIASELGHFGLANFLWCTQGIYETCYLILKYSLGLFFVFYLIYAEIMVGAICPFCTMIHIFLLVLFAISTKQLRHSVTLRRTVGKTTSQSVFSGSHLAEMIWGLKGWLFFIGATFAVPVVGFNM